MNEYERNKLAQIHHLVCTEALPRLFSARDLYHSARWSLDAQATKPLLETGVHTGLLGVRRRVRGGRPSFLHYFRPPSEAAPSPAELDALGVDRADPVRVADRYAGVQGLIGGELPSPMHECGCEGYPPVWWRVRYPGDFAWGPWTCWHCRGVPPAIPGIALETSAPLPPTLPPGQPVHADSGKPPQRERLGWDGVPKFYAADRCLAHPHAEHVWLATQWTTAWRCTLCLGPVPDDQADWLGWWTVRGDEAKPKYIPSNRSRAHG
jgi:hypothetical protein